jgi:GNAT superfamily N-acetyltransferase
MLLLSGGIMNYRNLVLIMTSVLASVCTSLSLFGVYNNVGSRDGFNVIKTVGKKPKKIFAGYFDKTKVAKIEYAISDKKINLDILEVSELYQSKGYGRKAMKAFLDECKRLHADIVTLIPQPLNSTTPQQEKVNKERLIKFYGSFGFQYNKQSDMMTLKLK